MFDDLDNNTVLLAFLMVFIGLVLQFKIGVIAIQAGLFIWGFLLLKKEWFPKFNLIETLSNLFKSNKTS